MFKLVFANITSTYRSILARDTTTPSCSLLNGIEEACWGKCDPATNKFDSSSFNKGDPWCWLADDDDDDDDAIIPCGGGASHNDASVCPKTCRPSDMSHGGCGPS